MQTDDTSRPPDEAADQPRDDELIVEFDGEGVSPATFHVAASLDFAAAWLELVQRLAAEHEHSLELRGLRILDKCVALAASSNNPDIAHECAAEARLLIANDSERPKLAKGLRGSISRCRSTLSRLPSHYVTNVSVGTRPVGIISIGKAAPPQPREGLITRARLMKIGGTEPKARFTSPFEERDFSLSTTTLQAQRLGALLYRELEIDADVSRRSDGSIGEGRLNHFIHLESEANPLDMLRDWFIKSGRDFHEPERLYSSEGEH